MRKSLSIIILAAGLLLYPFATAGADYGSQSSSPQNRQVPPVAQPLVREGDFAVKLAAALELGSPESEAEATDLLARAGVVPVNGWIPDYPMTPAVLGQLQDAMAKAASGGALPMNVEEATRRLFDLSQEMNLPTPAAPGTTEAEGAPTSGQYPPAVVNNYYYDYGPPIVTYYPPPASYAYLYAWVPYPSWWFGFWFPGFYICHDFTTVVVVNRRPVIVTNRVLDPFTRRHAILTPTVLTPTVRTDRVTVRPLTMLRTEDGRTFRDFSEMRKEAGRSGLHSGRTDTPAKKTFRSEGFRNPDARKSAGRIVSRDIERMRGSRGPEDGVVREKERRHAAPGTSERSYRPPAARESGDSGRPFVAPGKPSREGDRRSIVPRSTDRSFNGPATRSMERRFAAPRQAERTFSAPLRGGERPFVSPGPKARSFKGGRGDGERGFERRFFGRDRRGR